MTFKNRIIKFLLKAYDKLFPARHSALGKERCFLIVTTTGLGDTLWATPAIKALAETYPQAKIIVLTSPIGKEVLGCSPHIDEFIVLKKASFFSLFKHFWTLQKKKIDTALIFHISQRPTLPLVYCTGASNIIGTKGINKGLDFLLTEALENKKVHEIQRRLEIVSKVKAVSYQPLLELYVEKQDEDLADAFLEKHKIPSYIPLIGIHPGAKDKFKQWSPKHFAETGARLASHFGAQVIITGDSSEKALVEEIAGHIKGAIALTERLPLRVVACLIRRMSLMIANDTGPMHVAFAMETPTIALFGPTDPKLCGPYLASKAIVIEKKPTCTPCLRKSCREPFCLLQISPEDVYNAALKLLYNKGVNGEAIL